MATYLSLELEPGKDEKTGAGISAEDVINTGNGETEKLQLLYLLRVRRYQMDASVLNGSSGMPVNYPSLAVMLLSGETDIVLDCDLDAQLMQVYIIDGWPGITAIHAALKIEADKEIRKRRDAPSAGVPELTGNNKKLWPEALLFFMFTRDVLAARIRYSLIAVEKIIAAKLFAELQRSAKTFNEAATKLEIKLTSEGRGQSGARGGPGSSRDEETLKIKNRLLLVEIHKKFIDLLNENKFLERLRIEMAVFESHIGTQNLYLQQKSEGLSGGVVMPEEREALPENRDIKTASEELQRIKAESIAAEQAIEQLRDSVGDICALLLLVIPQLKESFTIEDTELAILGSWKNMYLLIDDLGRVIGEGGSRVAFHLPIDMEKLDKLEPQFSSSFDPTATVAKKAIAEVSDDKAQLALISEEALLNAIDSGEFLLGSLEHVVASHYASDLIDALEERRNNEELLGDVAKWLSKISAVLSLFAIITSIAPSPQTKAIGVSIRSAALMLDVPLGIFYAYSTLHQLSQLDEALKLRVVESGFESIESIARIAEVIAIRGSLKDQLTEEFVKMLFENLAGRQWAVVKKYIHRRGYLYDIETLLPEDF